MKDFKRVLSLVLAAVMIIGGLTIAPVAAKADVADHVVIHELYGGGGNSKAIYTNDYIVLYNPTKTDVSLDGWAVHYTSASGSFGTDNITSLTGTIKAGGYYLIQEAAGSTVTDAPLPVTPDATGEIAMAKANGVLALAKNAEQLTGKDDEDIVDLVGFGTATTFEGTAGTKAISNTTSAQRTELGVDTNDNAADFSIVTPDLSYLLSAEEDSETDAAYYVAGSMNSWNECNADYKMTKDGDVYKFVIKALAAGSHKLKVTDGTWDNAWPSSDYAFDTVSEADATVIFDPATGTVTVESTGIGVVEYPDRYVAGSMNSWNACNEDYKLTENADGTFSIALTLAAGDYQFKITNGTWDKSWPNDNYSFTVEAESVVTIAMSTTDEVTVDIKAVGAGEDDDTTDDGTTDDGTTEPTVVTIAEALAAADEAECTVKGVITFISGLDVYVQDATGGIGVRFPSGSAPADIKLGDTIEVTGTKGAFGGMPQLGSPTYTKSEGLTLSAKEITIGALKDADLGTYVKIKGLKVTAISSSNVTLEDAEGNTIKLYKGIYGDDVVEGATVDVLAAVGTYNGYQLRNSDASEITVVAAPEDDTTDDGTTDDGTTEPTVVTIAEALAAADEAECTVKGVITFISGLDVYVQDATGGIGVRFPSGSAPEDIKLGDTIEVTGTKGAFGGMPQLGSPTYTKSEGLTLSAKETTIGALKDADLGTYVKIKGLKVTAVDASNVTLEDSEGKVIKLYKGTYGEEVVEGATVDVVAAVGTYNGYQLRNSDASEITVVAAPEDDTTEPETPAEPTLGTIAEALAAESNVKCKVKGVITFISGLDVYVQDATGGIGVRFPSGSAPEDIKLGDTIEVIGVRGAFGGMPQLGSPTYTKSEGLTLSAKETTIGALKDADLGTYVKIKGLKVTAVDASNVTLEDAEGNTIKLYKGTYGDDVVEGATVDVLAAVGTYNGYQLRNSNASEITVVTSDDTTGDDTTDDTTKPGDGTTDDGTTDDGTTDSKPEVKPEEKPAIKLEEEVVAEQVEKLEKVEEGTEKPVIIDMQTSSGDVATEVPAEILDAIKGKDVSVKLDMIGYTWTINGKDIVAENLEAINLEVTLDVEVIDKAVVDAIAKDDKTVQLSLTHDGDFGFDATLTINVGKENAGAYGNLYYHNAEGKLEFMGAGLINDKGDVELGFEHASDYVVVIGEDRTADETPDADTPDDDKQEVIDPKGDIPMVVPFMMIFGGVALAVVALTGKKKMA